MADTYSLLFRVNCENFFDKYKKLPLFDFSKFRKINVIYSSKTRKHKINCSSFNETVYFIFNPNGNNRKHRVKYPELKAVHVSR